MSNRNLNFVESYINGKTIYFVEHHATILLCLKKAYDESLIKKNSLLIHIDKHEDIGVHKEHIEKSRQLLNLTEEELREFVKNLHPDNSEFIINAKHSGLIKDTIAIIHKKDLTQPNYIEENPQETNRYEMNFGENNHKYYLEHTNSLTSLFLEKGSLFGDKNCHHDTRELYDSSESTILDIDLDFFTYEKDKLFTQDKDFLDKEFKSDSFKNLWNKSDIITIALEPSYCGSLNNSKIILSSLLNSIEGINPEKLEAEILEGLHLSLTKLRP